jgi:hypothetical protein
VLGVLAAPSRTALRPGRSPGHAAQGTQTAADRTAAVLRFRPRRKIILADPTRALAAAAARGFTGQTLGLDQQRALFRRWTTGTDGRLPS